MLQQFCISSFCYLLNKYFLAYIRYEVATENHVCQVFEDVCGHLTEVHHCGEYTLEDDSQPKLPACKLVHYLLLYVRIGGAGGIVPIRFALSVLNQCLIVS